VYGMVCRDIQLARISSRYFRELLEGSREVQDESTERGVRFNEVSRHKL